MGGVLDEDVVYRKSGLIDFEPVERSKKKHRSNWHRSAAWRLAHGTHVMDLACGYDPAENRGDRPIICVQLPSRITGDTSGADLDTYALDAIEYIVDRANRLGTHLPLVINFSYGMIGGPHDGTSELEIAIDEVLRRRRVHAPTEIVLPAGNNHLSRCHAKVTFSAKNETAELFWRILPEDLTPSFLEIWMPQGPSKDGRVSVSLIPPVGAVGINKLSESARLVLPQPRPSGEAPISWLGFYPADSFTERGVFLAVVEPTQKYWGRNKGWAPHGAWTLKIRNDSANGLEPNETIQLWIRRDETYYGHPLGGRQSYFEDAEYTVYNEYSGRPLDEDPEPRNASPPSKVRRRSLLSAIGTGRQPVVVGGFDLSSKRLANYSAGGPTSSGYRPGPDAVTVTEDSGLMRGVLAAGSRSGSVVPMNGTSVAAPQIARILADHLATKPTRYVDGRHYIEQLATQSETSNRWPTPPSLERGGHGRILPPAQRQVPRGKRIVRRDAGIR